MIAAKYNRSRVRGLGVAEVYSSTGRIWAAIRSTPPRPSSGRRTPPQPTVAAALLRVSGHAKGGDDTSATLPVTTLKIDRRPDTRIPLPPPAKWQREKNRRHITTPSPIDSRNTAATMAHTGGRRTYLVTLGLPHPQTHISISPYPHTQTPPLSHPNGVVLDRIGMPGDAPLGPSPATA